jgi:S1-C subfamily serine protease
MNLLDLTIIGLALSAGLGGYRLGLVARALSWAGMAIGIALAARFLPDVISHVQGPDPSARLLLAIGVLLGGAFLGQALGLLVGSKVHLVLPPGSRPLDRGAGAITGVLGVLLGVWLLLPTLAEVPGTVARQARSSRITRFVAAVAPAPPDTLQTLRRLVGDTQFPRVFDALRPSPVAGPPPADSGIPFGVLQAAIASTVEVQGPACGRIQEGSGFVVESGLIATNAHVVAGEGSTTVLTPDGRRLKATVVLFDPDRDLALLRAAVPAPPLAVGETRVDGRGAVLGHPGGGPLRAAPFGVRERVQAVGRDLYDRHPTRRSVLVLASSLAPGDSGGALVDDAGHVVGVAFAIAPDRPGTAYALATEELKAALAAPHATRVSTGACLAG